MTSAVPAKYKESPSILTHDTYFGCVMLFLEIKFTLSSCACVSKYHREFLVNEENKALIQRVITAQLCDLFTISPSFHRFYYSPLCHVPSLIHAFYADFGFIESIAFSEYHDRIKCSCTLWEERNQRLKWEDTATEYIESNGMMDGDNPFNEQYNAMEWKHEPFDFVTLCRTQSAHLLIHWLRVVLESNLRFPRGVLDIHLNVFLDGDCHHFLSGIAGTDTLLITAINHFDKTYGGQPMFPFLLRHLCGWPTTEFSRIIQFLCRNLMSTHSLHADLLVEALDDFCTSVEDRQIGADNYCVFIDEYNKYQQTLHLESFEDLYEITVDIICITNTDCDGCVEAGTDSILMQIFGKIGHLMIDKAGVAEVRSYFDGIRDRLNDKIEDEFHLLFLHLLGV